MRSVRYALALLAGMALGLGTPPVDAYPALWLGMVAFAWLLDGPPAPTRAPSGRPSGLASRVRLLLTGAMRGLAFGVGANLVVIRFVPAVVERFTSLPGVAGLLGLVLLSCLEGLRWMVVGVACETLARARVPRPLALAAGVYAGTFIPTMLPWTVAGLVSPWPQMIQLADVVGERGVAALMALVAGLAAGGLRAALRPTTRRRGLIELGAALALVAAQAEYGEARMRSVEIARTASEHVRLGLVQPGIAALARWDEERGPAILDGLTMLTRREEGHGAQIVVWPESAYPYRVPHDARRSLEDGRAILQPGVHGPLITGVLMRGDTDEVSYNSVVVATADGAISEPYDKRHLLWFGETVPLADRIPWIKRTFARGLGLVAGDHSTPLVSGPVRAAALVCYEDMLPEAGREAIAASPNLLVNVTNDAWFKDTEEPELHLRVSVPRTVELRRDMVRAVNQGPTAWVDAAGRVRSRASVLIPSTLTTMPALLEGPPTFYGRWGDAPWAIAMLLLANVAVWRARRPST
jgi:apolipoprotein N-acyltransferase